MAQPAIEFSHVWKRFRLRESHVSLRDLLAGIGRRLTGRTQALAHRQFWAVQDVDFSIGRGEAVGIIGPNGAGKSTILKLLSRILRPERGEIAVHGRLAGLIEVGAGFHGELTGRENVFLNGAILGMSRREIQRKFDEIVAFAGLEDFLDMPVKRYSSGMYARLGFAIAAHVNAEVLLVDEVLSVGDAVFRLRCTERIRKLVGGGTTLVFVTHDLEQMQSVCSRTLVLDGGQVAFAGSPGDAVGHYLETVAQTHASRRADLSLIAGREATAEVVQFRTLDSQGRPLPRIRPRQEFSLSVQVALSEPVASLVVEANLRSASGQGVLSLNSARDGRRLAGQVGENAVTIRVDSLPLAAGQYFWNVRAWDADSGASLADTPFRYPLVIHDSSPPCGMVYVEREWSCQKVNGEWRIENGECGAATIGAGNRW
jgi:lipopolysaccharide transport system ATP-binding protein